MTGEPERVLGDRTALPCPPTMTPGALDTQQWANVPLGEPAVWMVLGSMVYRLDGDPARNVAAVELSPRERAIAAGLLRYCLERVEDEGGAGGSG